MQTTFAVTYGFESETAISLDGSYGHVPAIGAGSIEVSPTGAVFAGTRRVIKRGVIIAAGVSTLLGAFFAFAMYGGNRVEPPFIVLSLVLIAIAVALYRKRYRDTPFRWDVPWKDVVEFTEHDVSGMHWSARLRGREAGTLTFSLLPESRGDFTELMTSFGETGWAKVVFAERELPESRVV